MTAQTAPRHPSAIDALGEAISHTQRRFFPLGISGWVTLGFVTFLESCPSGTGGREVKEKYQDDFRANSLLELINMAFGWIAGHMAIVVAAVMLIMVVSVAVVWIRSRSVFVYIDDVATGRADIVRPWNVHGGLADSYFLLCLVVKGIAFITVMLILGVSVLGIVWGVTHELAFGILALAAIPLSFLFIIALLAGLFFNMALRDFVAPLQIVRKVGAREAASILVDLFFARPWMWLGYAFVKFVVWFFVSIAILVASCATCCFGLLPLINEILFQPIYFAERAWSLRFLAHLGEDVFAALTPPPPMPTYYAPDDAPTAPIDLSEVDLDTPPKDETT